MKNFIENVISHNLVPCLKFKRIQWAGQVQILLLDHVPEKVLKAELMAIDQWVDSRLNGKNFSSVATGDWIHKIEHLRGRNYGISRLDYGL